MVKTKLDLKDRKLLFALDFHARDSNSVIAKKIGLSKQGVDYKIRNLMKKGVIRGFVPIIDASRLGYFYGRMFIKFHNLTKKKETEITKELVADKAVMWILKIEGPYDFAFATWVRSLKELKQISERLSERFGNYIKEKRESVGIRLAHFQSRYLIGTSKSEQIVFEEPTTLVEIDELEKEILRALSKDARTSLVNIAKSSGISAKVVAYHLKKLKEEKVLLGYSPIIDNDLIGFTFYKVLFYLKNVTKEEFDRFRSYLKGCPEIMYIVEEVGITDMDFELMLPSGESVFDFVDKIRFEFPILIKEYEAFRIKTLKFTLLPF